MLLKQTKIVASISDRRCDVDFIKQLFEAGMNVVRMNTAHASRCLLYTSPSPRDGLLSRMPSSA